MPVLEAHDSHRLAQRCLELAAASRVDDGFGWLRDDGTVDHARPAELWITARMTHVLALSTAAGDDRWHGLLEHGHHALRTSFRDAEHGGWYAVAHSDGSGWSKRLYEHAFVLLAATSLTAVDVPGSRETFGEILDVLDRHFWEDAAGAALEARTRDWSAVEDYRGANGNMHLVEALLAASEVSGDPQWAQRALRIVERLIGTEARAHEWRLPEHFDSSWTVLPEFNRDRPRDPFRPYGITPGHGLEWARLLIHLEVALGDAAPPWLVHAATGLAGRALTDGWQRPAGIVYTTGWDGVPVVRERFHWVACEGVLATHVLHERTGDAGWQQWHDLVLGYALAQHVDADGSWIHELDADTLQIARGTWNGRPDVYHAYQMLVMPRLPLRASAMGAVLAAR